MVATLHDRQVRARNIFGLDGDSASARHMRPMTTEPVESEVVALQARIFAGRLKLNEVLNRAGVNRSTWFRWVRGDAEPKLSTLRKIGAAIDAKLQEKNA